MVTCVVFLKVVKAVHFVHVHIQRPEALGDHPGPGVQDAPEVRLGQLLPVVKGGRTLQEEADSGAGGGGLGCQSKPAARSPPPSGPQQDLNPQDPSRWTLGGTRGAASPSLCNSS